MSSKQMAQQRRASERAQRMRHNEPAPLCSFAGTAVTPVPHAVRMCTSANVVGRRHDELQVDREATGEAA